MKQAAYFTLGTILLALVGSLASLRVFSPSKRRWSQVAPVQRLEEPLHSQGNLDGQREYRRIKLAFGSFDLFAGLTSREVRALASSVDGSFYLLLVCLWVAWFLRLNKVRRR
jgi:hypothetical protein